jgi:hypothetical protein
MRDLAMFFLTSLFMFPLTTLSEGQTKSVEWNSYKEMIKRCVEKAAVVYNDTDTCSK